MNSQRRDGNVPNNYYLYVCKCLEMHVATWYEAMMDEQYCGTRDCAIRSIEMPTGANINVIFHVLPIKSDIDGKFRGFDVSIYFFHHQIFPLSYCRRESMRISTKNTNINFTLWYFEFKVKWKFHIVTFYQVFLFFIDATSGISCTSRDKNDSWWAFLHLSSIRHV